MMLLIKRLLFLIPIIIFLGCANHFVPNEYRTVISLLLQETDALEAIPQQNTVLLSGDGLSIGVLTSTQRQDYFISHQGKWDQIFLELEKAKESMKASDWHDDVLFCLSIAYLKVSTLSKDNKYTNSAISSITDFIALGDNTSIEEWTKKQFKNNVWTSLKNGFSETMTEKRNINQFFYLAKATLLERNKNIEKALESHKKAIDINPNSLWGKQSKYEVIRLNQVRAEGKQGNQVGNQEGHLK